MPVIVFIGILLVGIAVSFVVNIILTSITIWSVNQIFTFDMPFWPVFWLLVVIAALVGGGSAAGKSKS